MTSVSSVIFDDNSVKYWSSTFHLYMIALCHEPGKFDKLSRWETVIGKSVFKLQKHCINDMAIRKTCYLAEYILETFKQFCSINRVIEGPLHKGSTKKLF